MARAIVVYVVETDNGEVRESPQFIARLIGYHGEEAPEEHIAKYEYLADVDTRYFYIEPEAAEALQMVFTTATNSDSTAGFKKRLDKSWMEILRKFEISIGEEDKWLRKMWKEKRKRK